MKEKKKTVTNYDSKFDFLLVILTVMSLMSIHYAQFTARKRNNIISASTFIVFFGLAILQCRHVGPFDSIPVQVSNI